MRIHETSIIGEGVKLGKNVSVGAFSLLEGDIEIGEDTVIGNRVTIKGRVKIGKNCKIYDGAVIGEEPQHLDYKGEDTEVVIGDNVIIREYVTVHRGTALDKGKTVIGNNCMLMAYSHVAHDCVLGDNVVMANCATLAGHVEIGNNVFMGGLSAVQQKTKIGSYSMIGGLTGVNKHVPPFTKAAGNHVQLYGINTIGLGRAGFSEEEIAALKKAYIILFKRSLTLKEGIQEIKRSSLGANKRVMELVEFIEKVRRDKKDRIGIASDGKKKNAKEGIVS